MTIIDVIAIMPLIILTAGSVFCLLAGAVRPGFYLYRLAVAVTAAAMLWSAAVPSSAVMPGLTVTLFSRSCSAFLYGAGIVALLLSEGYNRRRGIAGEEYPATVLFALTGMGATCAAGNLLMLFLGLEAFTFALYILVAIEPGSDRGGEAGMKYLLTGTLSAAVMAMGIALLYCSRGTLGIADLSGAIRAAAVTPLDTAGFAMILVGLAFKLSLVPAHLWTPDVYQGAPAPVTAFLSTASKGAAVVALMILAPLFSAWRGFHDLLWLLSLLSLISGNLAALQQNSLKRMLAWSSIAQMGYVALALVALPAGGGRAALFYIAAYALAGLASFGAVAVLSQETERDDMECWRGAGFRHPLAGAALAAAMFSLAGIPPTAGFMAKFAVFAAALRAGEVTLAVIGVLMALVSVYFYLRVVVTLYMKPDDGKDRPGSAPLLTERAVLAVLLLMVVAAGIYPSPLLELIDGILP